ARDARPLVQKAHEHFVDAIDVAAQVVERTDYCFRAVARRRLSPLFSQRTYSSTLPARSGCRPCSATTDTSALPTTAASAYVPTAATWSGLEMPNPSAIGIDVRALIRRTSDSAPDATWFLAPVTPSREIP